MQTAFTVLMWLVAGVVGVFILLFLIGGALGVWRQLKQIRASGTKLYLQQVTATVQRHAGKLGTFPALIIGLWYVLILGGVVYVAYDLLNDTPALGPLDVIQDNATALFLVQCFNAGCVGAIIYGMLQVSKGERELATEWLLRRYILLPILGGFLGSASYFLLGAGLIEAPAGEAKDANAQHLVYAIAFLSGFASREVTAKLIQIAQTVFTKVTPPEESPPKPSAPAESPPEPSAPEESPPEPSAPAPSL